MICYNPPTFERGACAPQKIGLPKEGTIVVIKYYCPKCRKCFVEWGAKKAGFKCLACEGEELNLLDSAYLIESSDKPKLKRVSPKKHQPVPIGNALDEDDGIIDVPMDDEEFEEGEIEEVEDVIEGVDEFGAAEDTMPLLF